MKGGKAKAGPADDAGAVTTGNNAASCHEPDRASKGGLGIACA